MCYSSCAIYYTLFNHTGDMQKIYVHLLSYRRWRWNRFTRPRWLCETRVQLKATQIPVSYANIPKFILWYRCMNDPVIVQTVLVDIINLHKLLIYININFLNDPVSRKISRYKETRKLIHYYLLSIYYLLLLHIY